MMTCPNCGQPVEPGKLICPHCGAFLAPPPTPPPAVWPPPPGGANPGGWSPPPERLLTGRRWLDFLIGFVPPPGLAVLFLVGLGTEHSWLSGLSALLFVVCMVLCVVLQRPYPVVARGLGWGLVAIPLLAVLFMLGAFAACLISAGSGRL